jgi:hypothetical protein
VTVDRRHTGSANVNWLRAESIVSFHDHTGEPFSLLETYFSRSVVTPQLGLPLPDLSLFNKHGILGTNM